MKRILLLILSLIGGAALGADRPSPVHQPAPSTRSAQEPVTTGRSLLGQLGCTACHAPSESQGKWLSPKTAPRLAEIGNRASPEWIQRYLAASQETMPGTMMPDQFHGLSAEDRTSSAESLTHYLLSQRTPTFKRVLPDRGAVARGESLYHRVGCVACHAPQKSGAGVAEGLPSIPASIPLPRMADKWSFDGLRRFLLDPLASRPSGRMPAMRLTDGEASDIAHYLLRETRVPAAVELAMYRGTIRSLEDIETAELIATEPVELIAVNAATRDRGGGGALRLSSFLRIDQAGDYTFHFAASGASRMAIDGHWLAGEESWEHEAVDAMLTQHLEVGLHALRVDYVHRGRKPQAMKLEWEGPGIAREVIPAARLRSDREAMFSPPLYVVDARKAEVGRTLYEKWSCSTCHDGKAPAKPMLAMTALNESSGCLAASPRADLPDFHFDVEQREALRMAIRFLNRADLGAPSSAERVGQTMVAFNCTACHTRDGIGGVTATRDRYFTSNGEDLGEEGRLPPGLNGVGDKLQSAWLDQVLTQGASVRPYLNTRMPQFGKENVAGVTELLVGVDRKPKDLAPSTDAVAAQKEAGRTMVGTDGFSCIACHRFNRQPAQTLQVMDLITSTQRLNEDWFRQFLLDPNRFHPATRMPAFWPDGKSALPKLLGGDSNRQHAAIWTYLADGPRAKSPQGLSRQNVELVVGGEAVVYRGKLWEAGFRAVAVGYPGQLNAAFDAEEMRLSLLWRGKFLNAGPHWQIQGMGQIRPLGTDVIVLPRGSPMAVLADSGTPWPSEASRAMGFKFRGYQLDALQRPRFLYAFGNVGLEDLLTPIEGRQKTGFRRKLVFTEMLPEGLHLRLAVGKLKPTGDNTWRLNDPLTIAVLSGGKAFVRGTGEQQELLIAVRFVEQNRQLEVEYVW